MPCRVCPPPHLVLVPLLVPKFPPGVTWGRDSHGEEGTHPGMGWGHPGMGWGHSGMVLGISGHVLGRQAGMFWGHTRGWFGDTPGDGLGTLGDGFGDTQGYFADTQRRFGDTHEDVLGTHAEIGWGHSGVVLGTRPGMFWGHPRMIWGHTRRCFGDTNRGKGRRCRIQGSDRAPSAQRGRFPRAAPRPPLCPAGLGGSPSPSPALPSPPKPLPSPPSPASPRLRTWAGGGGCAALPFASPLRGRERELFVPAVAFPAGCRTPGLPNPASTGATGSPRSSGTANATGAGHGRDRHGWHRAPRPHPPASKRSGGPWQRLSPRWWPPAALSPPWWPLSPTVPTVVTMPGAGSGR